MSNTIATISGVMLSPGMSLNRRLYTPELIAKTVARMRERIGDPSGLPITVRSHHAADDDSTRIVGRITSVDTDESGAARYKADLYNTSAARDIANLITGDKPALRSTSIHGYWLGPVQRVEHEGVYCETAQDLEIGSVDFTATPGVPSAVLDISPINPRETVETRTPISESFDATVTAVDESGDAPYGPKSKVAYADPGYQADKKPRYPIDTKAHVRAALSYVAKDSNAKQYTPKQLARIKAKIKAAARKFGIDVANESVTTWGEVREYYPEGPDGQAGMCVDLFNGPTSLTMRCTGVDPADLRVIATAAMDAACDALQAMDPDMDADIDAAGVASFNAGETVDINVAGSVWTTGDLVKEVQRQTARNGIMTLTELREQAGSPPTEPPPPQSSPAVTVGASTTGQEPTVSEATETAAGTTVAPANNRTLTDADIQALGAVFAIALKEHAPAVAPVVETAPVPQQLATPTTEAAPKAKSGKKALKEALAKSTASLAETIRTELGTTIPTAVATETQKAVTAAVAEATDQLRDELREELKRTNAGRRGFRVHENEQQDPTPEAAFDDRAQLLLGDFGKTPVPQAGTGIAPAPTAPAATG